MRKYFILLYLLLPIIGFSQINLPEINGEADWEKVIITRNPNDVIGLERVTTLNAETQKLFGKQSKLRKKAIEKLKKEASKQGIQIVLITLDNFSMSPINNVALEGIGYKKQE